MKNIRQSFENQRITRDQIEKLKLAGFNINESSTQAYGFTPAKYPKSSNTKKPLIPLPLSGNVSKNGFVSRFAGNIGTFGVLDPIQTVSDIDTVMNRLAKNNVYDNIMMFDIETSGPLPDTAKGIYSDLFSVNEVAYGKMSIYNGKNGLESSIASAQDVQATLYRPKPKMAKLARQAIADIEAGKKLNFKDSDWLYKTLFDYSKYSESYQKEYAKTGLRYKEGVDLKKMLSYIKEGLDTLDNDKNEVFDSSSVKKLQKEMAKNMGSEITSYAHFNGKTFDNPILKHFGFNFNNADQLDLLEVFRLARPNNALHKPDQKGGYYTVQSLLDKVEAHIGTEDVKDTAPLAGPLLNSATKTNGHILPHLNPGNKIDLVGKASPENNFIITKNIKSEVFSNEKNLDRVVKRGSNAKLNSIHKVDGQYIATFTTDNGTFQIAKNTEAELRQNINSNFAQIHDEVANEYRMAKKKIGSEVGGYSKGIFDKTKKKPGSTYAKDFAIEARRTHSRIVDSILPSSLLSSNVVSFNVGGKTMYFDRLNSQATFEQLKKLSPRQIKEISSMIQLKGKPFDTLSNTITGQGNYIAKLNLLVNAIGHDGLENKEGLVKVYNGKSEVAKLIRNIGSSHGPKTNKMLNGLNSMTRDPFDIIRLSEERLGERKLDLTNKTKITNFGNTMKEQLDGIIGHSSKAGLGHTFLEKDGKLKLALFHNSKSEEVARKLMAGEALGVQDAVFVNIPMIDKYGNVTVGNSTKANVAKVRLVSANASPFFRFASQDMLAAIDNKDTIIGIAESLKSGNTARAQYTITKRMGAAYLDLPSTNRYSYNEIMDNLNSSNKLSSWNKGNYMDVSNVIESVLGGKKFGELYPTEAANILRDSLGFSDNAGKRYSKLKDEQIKSIRDQFVHMGITPATIDLSGIKGESLWAKGMISLTSARIASPMGYLNEAVKDNTRAALNYLPKTKDGIKSVFIGEQFDNKRGDMLRIINMTDKDISRAIDDTISKTTNKSDLDYLRKFKDGIATPTTYDGSMVMNSKYSSKLARAKEKLFKIDTSELSIVEGLTNGQELNYGDVLAKGEEGSIGDIIFKGRNGGKFKGIKTDPETGMVNIITDVNLGTQDGLKLGSASGGLKATARFQDNRFFQLLFGKNTDIAGIAHLETLDTTLTAEKVMGQLDYIVQKSREKKIMKNQELIDLINNVIFSKTNVKASTAAHGQILLPHLNKEEFESNFLSKATGKDSFFNIYEKLDSFKTQFVNGRGPGAQGIIDDLTFNGHDISNIMVQVQDIDPSEAVYGKTGKGISFGVRDFNSYRNNKAFYNLVNPGYAKSEGLVEKSFKNILNPTSGIVDPSRGYGREKFSSYAYALLSADKQEVLKNGGGIENILRPVKDGWLDQNKERYTNLNTYDSTLHDPNKLISEQRNLMAIDYKSSLTDEYTSSINEHTIGGTLLDDKMYDGKAGLIYRLPEKVVLPGSSDINAIESIFIPKQQEVIRTGGAYRPDAVTEAADRVIRNSETLGRAHQGKGDLDKARANYSTSVADYFSEVNKQMTSNNGSLVGDTLSGRINHSAYLSTGAINTESYSAMSAANKAGQIFENAEYINEKNIRGMLEGADEKKLLELHNHMSQTAGLSIDSSKASANVDDIISLMRDNNAELPSYSLRYPNIGPGSLQSSAIRYISNEKTNNNISIHTLGSFIRQGGDYDGDKSVAFLPYLSDSKTSSSKMSSYFSEMRQERVIEARKSTAVANWALEKYSQGNNGMDNMSIKDASVLSKALSSGSLDPQEEKTLIQKFGMNNKQEVLDSFYSSLSEHTGSYGKNLANLEFESRATKIIGGISNISEVYRNFVTNLDVVGGDSKLKGLATPLSHVFGMMEQSSISSKHIGKVDPSQMGGMISAAQDLQTGLRNTKTVDIMDAIDRLGVFDAKTGNLNKHFGPQFEESMKMAAEIMGGPENKLSHREIFQNSFQIIEDLTKAGASGNAHVSGVLARYGVAETGSSAYEKIQNTVSMFKDDMGHIEYSSTISDMLNEAGIQKEFRTNLSNHLKNASGEMLNSPERASMQGYFEEAVNGINSQIRKNRTSAPGLNLNGLVKASPYIALGAGILGITGAMSAPSVKRNQTHGQADQAPSSDGQYVDPVLQNTLAQSAPLGSGPTARVSPNGSGYQKINVKINGNATKGLTTEEMSGIIEEEIKRQTSLPINLNITNSDDRSTIDRSWVQSEFLKAVRKN